MKTGDRVVLMEAQKSHPWTGELVGEEGRVVEVKENAVAVEGLMDGDPLWFSLKRLKSLESEAA